MSNFPPLRIGYFLRDKAQKNNPLSTNCLSVSDHFVGLALKGLR